MPVPHPAQAVLERAIGSSVTGNPRAVCAEAVAALQRAGLLVQPKPAVPVRESVHALPRHRAPEVRLRRSEVEALASCASD